MRPASGFIRVHLLTLLFAMLAVSVLLGLNLLPRRESHFCFYSPDSGQIRTSYMHNSDVLVEYESRAWYGWPYILVSSHETRQSIFSRDEELELRYLPVHTDGCVVAALDAEQFKTRAPLLYRKFQKPQYTMDPLYSWDFEHVLQYICGALALLFTAMLLLEYHIRRAADPAQDPEFLPSA